MSFWTGTFGASGRGIALFLCGSPGPGRGRGLGALSTVLRAGGSWRARQWVCALGPSPHCDTRREQWLCPIQVPQEHGKTGLSWLSVSPSGAGSHVARCTQSSGCFLVPEEGSRRRRKLRTPGKPRFRGGQVCATAGSPYSPPLSSIPKPLKVLLPQLLQLLPGDAPPRTSYDETTKWLTPGPSPPRMVVMHTDITPVSPKVAQTFSLPGIVHDVEP